MSQGRNRRREQPGRARIVDVARAAGVSRQTVSNAVNYPDRVAPETLERVHREIASLGFRPNLAARSLRHQRSNALGMELNSLGGRRLGTVLDPFLVELTVASRRHDAHLVPFAAADHDRPLPAYEDLVASQLVDAFILSDTRHDDPRPAWLQQRGIPFASFGRIWDDPAVTSWVDVDGFSGVVDGVRHLHERGYERIGFLGWPVGSPVGDDRRAGWLSATRETGCFQPRWQAASVQDISTAAATAAPLITALGRGGALVCASDILAMGAWTVLRDRGMTPGPDFGLVGFDDSDLAQSFGLTSLQQPLRAVAEQILDMLQASRAGEPPPEEGVTHLPVVIARASSYRSVLPPPVPRP